MKKRYGDKNKIVDIIKNVIAKRQPQMVAQQAPKPAVPAVPMAPEVKK
jgi:hypothetical protein